MTEPEDRAESFLEKSSSVRMSHIEDIGEIGNLEDLVLVEMPLIERERAKAGLWASLIGMVGSTLGIVATGLRLWTKADQTSTIILVAGLGILVFVSVVLTLQRRSRRRKPVNPSLYEVQDGTLRELIRYLSAGQDEFNHALVSSQAKQS
jgi:hypothetical protein